MITKTIARSLLPALLLALAACVVKTDDLKPKTDEECVPLGQKACGPRCVSLDDPSTGCGAPGCGPCPGGPSGTVSFCNLGACDYRAEGCEPGKDQCDGTGGCEDLQTDPLHCGACGHDCLGALCTAGTCEPSISIPGNPADFVVLDLASVPGGGNILYIADGFGGAWGAGRYVGVAAVEASPLGWVDRLVMDPATWTAYVTMAENGAPIAEIPSATATANAHFTPTGSVRSLVVTPSDLWMTTIDGTNVLQEKNDLLQVSRGDPTVWISWDMGLGALAGVAYFDDGFGGRIAYGTEAGTLEWDSLDFASRSTIATGVPVPTQIAVFNDIVGTELSPRTIVFWASESDGSVHSKELPGGAVYQMWSPAGPSRMDIWADATGVYWSDAANGIVAEWRAFQNDVVLLHAGGQPVTVLQYFDYVYWSDAVDHAVKAVPR